MKNSTFLIVMAAATSAVLAGNASAQTYTTSKSAFLAGAGSLTTLDFNDQVVPASFNTPGTSYTYKGVTFGVDIAGPNGNGNSVGLTPYASTYNLDGSQFVAFDLSQGATTTLAFSNPTTSIGFDLRGFADGRSEVISIFDIYGNLITSQSVLNPGSGDISFAGFFGSQSISKLTIKNTGNSNDYFGFDNLLTSSVAAVPEPASWAMMILGMGAVGGALRRRQKTTTRVAFAV
jgi:hypothetical protein